MTPITETRERLLTTDREASLARQTLKDLRGADRGLSVERDGEHISTLPRELGIILQQVLDTVARGGTVTVSAVPKVLTTSAAASILGVSRPTLMKMIAEGAIASHKVGTHHRLSADDVFAAKRERRARERAAFNSLRDLDDRVV